LNGGWVSVWSKLKFLNHFIPILISTHVFRIAAPLVFGPDAINYYRDLNMYGRTLQDIINPNNVLKFLDKNLLIKTSYIMCRGPREDLYDPRFILRLFLSMVHRGTEVSAWIFWFWLTLFHFPAQMFSLHCRRCSSICVVSVEFAWCRVAFNCLRYPAAFSYTYQWIVRRRLSGAAANQLLFAFDQVRSEEAESKVDIA
jgi:hypothetical protein